MIEEKDKVRGEGLTSSSVSKKDTPNPRSRPRPRKTEEQDLGPRLVLVRRPLENSNSIYFNKVFISEFQEVKFSDKKNDLKNESFIPNN